MPTARTLRDGFKNQHMIVLPEPLRVAARRHRLLSGLFVTDAGYFPAAANHLVERLHGAETTLVILCLRGHGWVRSAAGRRTVAAGDLVWLPAHELHAYGAADQGEPWTISWAHFEGDEVAAWRALFAVPDLPRAFVQTLPCDRLDEIELDRVHVALGRGYALRHQVAAAAALRQTLAAAAQLANAPRGGRSPGDRVMASIEMLRRDWQQPHRLRELATAAGVSVTHYSAIFRRHTGFSPIDYLIRLRVQHACWLLDTTRMSVGEVAEQCGYRDPYYFTRCFRRVMGCAPRTYRNVPKG
jgi:AraC-like DNA-binding protein